MYFLFSVLFATLLIISLFVEMFFNIPLDFGVSHTSTVVCFNLLKVIFTMAFVFFILMGTLWSKSEKSAILTGKYSMMLLLKRMKKPPDEINGT